GYWGLGGGTAGDGARVSELEAAQRLDPTHVAVLQQLPERSRGHSGADGVQPAAADAHPRPSGGRSLANCFEGSGGPREQPGRNGGVLHTSEETRQDGRNGGPLRCQPSRQEDEPDEPPHY